MNRINIKRIYEKAEATDGYRVLVDRLWPRGITKDAAHIQAWKREIAPSDRIRKAFGHKEDHFEPFRKEYLHELSDNPQAHSFAFLCRNRLPSENITLVYSAKDELHNNAAILREWLCQNLE